MPPTNSKPVWPYPKIDHFPGRLERFSYRSYNWFENRLWPVRPLPFLALIATVTGFQLRDVGLRELQNDLQLVLRPLTVSVGSVYASVFVLRHLLKYLYFSYKGFLKENPKKPSYRTIVWGAVRSVLLKVAPPQLGSCDLLLPNLPLPGLDDTVRRYLESVKHFVSEIEYKQLVDKSKSFLDGEGRTLQRYAWLLHKCTDNYVTSFWEKYIYNAGRYPLLINSSIAQCVLYGENELTQVYQTARLLYIETLANLSLDRQKYMAVGRRGSSPDQRTMNYAVEENGRGGATGEHSPCDGAELDHLCENFLNLDKQILESPSREEQEEAAIVTEKDLKTLKLAEKLEFEDVEGMEAEVERCFESHLKASNDLHMHSIAFLDFGKGRLKKCGVSPDGFVQMAIQLAYFKDQGKFTLTYEPGSVRFYANSRTETLRPVTEASCKFVTAMLDEQSNNTERRRLLKEACDVHVNNNKEIMLGKGVDRHLFVLCVLAKGLGYSSPFLDYFQSQKWLLSTSNIPNMTNSIDEDSSEDKIMLGGSFGAVAQDGYGICYRFGGNRAILVHITSYHSSDVTDSDRMGRRLKEAFHLLADLFDN